LLINNFCHSAYVSVWAYQPSLAYQRQVKVENRWEHGRQPVDAGGNQHVLGRPQALHFEFAHYFFLAANGGSIDDMPVFKCFSFTTYARAISSRSPR